MNKNSKILILGSRGLVGSAILKQLRSQGYSNILCPIRENLELLNQHEVLTFFDQHHPDVVIIAAAKVGGILANNTYRADFIFENLQVQQNVFNAAFRFKTPKLLFLGSSCIYPKNSPQPIKEEYLLSGYLEPTNEPYAIAKIAGLKTVESFRRQYGLDWISVMPTNLYGENDNFHPENSHVIPGLICRFQRAIKNGDKKFLVWGSGKPRREFLFSTDMANACIFLMNYKGHLPDYVNIGSGTDIQINELVNIIANKMGFLGQIEYDTTKPDGTLRKLLDISKIKNLGWSPQYSLDEGLSLVIDFYRKSNIK